MNIVMNLVLALQILTALVMIGLVLIQHGKGADMGASFGSGASGSLFGASGSANFLSRTTAILAAVFFASSLGLTWFGSRHGATTGVMHQGVMEKMAPKSSDIPAGPTAPPPGAPAAGPAKAAEPAKVTPPTAPAVPGTDGSKANEVPK